MRDDSEARAEAPPGASRRLAGARTPAPQRRRTASAARSGGEEDLDEAMNRLRKGLREDGWGRFVPMRMDSPVLD